MSVPTPYVRENYIVYADEIVKAGLSLAIWLIDEYTGKQPSTYIQVTRDQDKMMRAARNLSGYYFFSDLSAEDHEVSIESGLYFPESKTISTPSLDPKNPVVEIILTPNPSYPFPEHATLIRGLVWGTGPVAGAEIKATGKTAQTLTNEKGEFVLFFKGIKNEDISLEIKKNGITKNAEITIAEGRTISAGVFQFP